MSESVKGVIEGVSCKEGNDHPKYGMSYQTSIKVSGDWYGAFTKKTAEQLGLEKGKLVTFTYTENGKYKNFDPKTLKVSETAEPGQQKAASGGARGGGFERAIARGQAVNNAVALYVNGKATNLRDALKTAIELHAVADHFFDKLLSGVDVATALKGNDAPAAKAASEAPAAKATTPKAKAAGKAKAKPEPQPDPEPEADDDTPPPVEAPAEPEFDDDIPF